MKSARAFTLVEILIVVSILGILAALVVPRFTGATDLAKASAARTQLNTLRTQVQAWQADHRGNFPTLADLQQGALDWGVMTGKTDVDGTINAAGDFGPYITEAPLNPFNQKTLVVNAGAAVETAGWTYDESNGKIRIIIPAAMNPAEVTDLGADEYEQP